MKPNLIIVQPPHVDSDSVIDQFCETMCESHYVYLIRPITGFREDSAAGVRYLNLTADRFPGFGEVEAVIVVDCAEMAGRLKDTYPAAHHALWKIEADGELPFSLVPSLSDRIIRADFGLGQEEPLAKAM